MTVEQLVGRVFNVDADEIGDFSSRETIGSWDSMGHLNLIMELEEQFCVSISIVDAVEIVNVRKIKDMLRTHGVNC